MITDSQLPQNIKVKDINKKPTDNLHWINSQGETQRSKQAPQFTILPRNIQVNFFIKIINNKREYTKKHAYKVKRKLV